MFADLPSQPSLVIVLDTRDEAILIASHGTRRRLMSPLRRSSLSPSGAPRTTASHNAMNSSLSGRVHRPSLQQLPATATPDGHTQGSPSGCEIFQSITTAPTLQLQSFEELRLECYRQCQIATERPPVPVSASNPCIPPKFVPIVVQSPGDDATVEMFE